jgi:cytosine/adenosine deaminase-related metal-dependent hydrolase
MGGMARRIINASHVIAYQDGGHHYLRGGIVVIEGDSMIHVGPAGSFDEPVDEVLDATGKILTPGLINTHAHLYESPLDKSFVEDRGSRQFYLSGLFEYLPVRAAAQDDEASRACLAYSMTELLRTEVATAADVFNAATLGDAKALGRDDLGRIAPDAKAELLIWEGQSLFMTPLRDPIKNIVYSAQAEDLNTAIIDGEIRMRDRQILGVDLPTLTRNLQAAGDRMWPAMTPADWAKRTTDRLSPQSFPAFE